MRRNILNETYEDVYEDVDESYDEDMHEGADLDEMEDELEEAYATIDELVQEADESRDMLLKAGATISLLRAANRLGESRYLEMVSELPPLDEFRSVEQFNEHVETYALEVFNEDFNGDTSSAASLNESTQHRVHQTQGNPLGVHGVNMLQNFGRQG